MASKDDAAAKLAAQKRANSLQATQEWLNGQDNKRTRDGGTTRRVWRQKK